ncbi:MAG: hypothetical protein EPN93_13665 [Spirochaetes bacterium]|nr:MAG: hypothetical protein EPN93_13665 [Spirochaetota bacterium]
MKEAIQAKNRVSKKVEKNVFGFSYIGTACPILDKSGNVQGGLNEQNDILNELSAITQQLLTVSVVLSTLTQKMIQRN